jgi:hypothetical protein
MPCLWRLDEGVYCDQTRNGVATDIEASIVTRGYAFKDPLGRKRVKMLTLKADRISGESVFLVEPYSATSDDETRDKEHVREFKAEVSTFPYAGKSVVMDFSIDSAPDFIHQFMISWKGPSDISIIRVEAEYYSSGGESADAQVQPMNIPCHRRSSEWL